MFNFIRYGWVILGLLFPMMTHAYSCNRLIPASAYAGSSYTGRSALLACDISFTTIPTFATMCLGSIQSGVFTITNNTPIALTINYIRLQNNGALPNTAATVVAAPTNNCGSTLAAGASCNIQVNLQPLALGTFNEVLQVGINSRQIQLAAPAITTVVNCSVGPPTPGPFAGAPSILAFSTITNTGPTVINGDVDLTPGTSITGFPPGTVLNGVFNIANGTAATARTNATTFFTTQNALPCTTNLTGQDLGAVGPLAPGVYCFNSSAQLTGALVLAGAGSYTFQIASTLTTASNSSVVLTGGATSVNVNFIIGSSATIGIGTAFQGNLDAFTSVSFNTGASLLGRAWALNGAVTLQDNVINPG